VPQCTAIVLICHKLRMPRRPVNAPVVRHVAHGQRLGRRQHRHVILHAEKLHPGRVRINTFEQCIGNHMTQPAQHKRQIILDTLPRHPLGIHQAESDMIHHLLRKWLLRRPRRGPWPHAITAKRPIQHQVRVAVQVALNVAPGELPPI
jgi:hypothetical protein